MGLFEKKEKEAVEEVLTAEDIKEIAPLYEKVILALKQVYDPEIPVNIYDLGLIYELNIRKSRQVYIKMTFTAPGVTGCEIDLVFEPAWDQSMLSDEARVILGYDIDFDDDDVEVVK